MSNADRQQRFRERRQQELTTLRCEVETLRAELVAARARERSDIGTMTAEAIVDQLAGELPPARLAQVWVMLGERLKATMPRGRQNEALAPRRGRNLAQISLSVHPAPAARFAEKER